nr:hypothetical protein [Tanacetum cinerariifolium]
MTTKWYVLEKTLVRLLYKFTLQSLAIGPYARKDLRTSYLYILIVQSIGMMPYRLETENRRLTHYKLNIEDHEYPIITTIQISQDHEQLIITTMLPMIISIGIPHTLHLEGKLFESLGCLVLVRKDCISSSKFTIYHIRKGCYVWSSKYTVNTDDFMNPLPDRWSIQSIVWSIVLGEREYDSFIIINFSTKVVQYNLISKTLREIYDMGYNEIFDDYLHGFIPPYATYDVGYKKLDYKVFEFIPSSASV